MSAQFRKAKNIFCMNFCLPYDIYIKFMITLSNLRIQECSRIMKTLYAGKHQQVGCNRSLIGSSLTGRGASPLHATNWFKYLRNWHDNRIT